MIWFDYAALSVGLRCKSGGLPSFWRYANYKKRAVGDNECTRRMCKHALQQGMSAGNQRRALIRKHQAGRKGNAWL